MGHIVRWDILLDETYCCNGTSARWDILLDGTLLNVTYCLMGIHMGPIVRYGMLSETC